MQDTSQTRITSQLSSILLLASISFFNLLNRVIFSPLLLTIEKDLMISHTEAGSFFLLISLGYTFTILVSGFVSSKISHRGTILLSILSEGLALLLISFIPFLIGVRIGLFLLGMGCGFYIPSGMSTVTGLVDSRHWGKAISLHEIGPSMSFIIAPILAEFSLRFTSWRGVLIILGISSLIMGTVFFLFGKGGNFYGQPPHLDNLRLVLSQSSFWALTILFSVIVGAGLGVYSIFPTFLVSEKGMNQGLVNTIVSLSRVSGLFMIFLAGWLVDRFDIKLLIGAVIALSGILTGLLGCTNNTLLVIVVFLQPMVIVCFFPVAFVSLANIGSRHTYNVALSLMIPFAYLFGGGVVPALMGILGEHRSFAIGFFLIGGSLLLSLSLLFLLKFKDESYTSQE